MPLYEFGCSKCGYEFEQIVFSSDSAPVKCPKCGAAKPKRLLSVFSSTNSKSTGDYSPSSCAPSSTGFS